MNMNSIINVTEINGRMGKEGGGIYIKPRTGLSAEQPVRRNFPKDPLTFSEGIRLAAKAVKEFVKPPKKETFPPEEW